MPGYELVGNEELDALKAIFTTSNGCLFAHGFPAMRNGIYRVRQFEQALAKKFSSKHCQVVTSGTAAQFVTMRALGIGPGDEVITQAFTFIATVEAILECGATPVVVDVDETLNMCPTSLAAAITLKTKAIVPVHMLGNTAKMDEINTIAAQHDIPVLEDACEALGATYKGKPVGTLGRAGFFSLDFGKTITSGEGGFILTDDTNLFAKMAAYHDHGHMNAPNVPRGQDPALCSGFNFRMSEMQAAVGIVQLAKLDLIVERNRAHKHILKDAVGTAGGSLIKFRELTDPEGELADTLMFFTPDQETAQSLVAKLAERGIGTKNVPDAMNWHFADRWAHIWKNSPLYRETYRTQWKSSASLLERCVSLPILVNWTPDQLDLVATKVSAAIGELV